MRLLAPRGGGEDAAVKEKAVADRLLDFGRRLYTAGVGSPAVDPFGEPSGKGEATVPNAPR